VTGDLDLRHIDVRRHGHEPPLYWGIWGLMIVEAVVFASLISSFLYLRLLADNWPPAGTEPPSLLLPTINTGVILATMPFVRIADRAVTAGHRGRLVLGLAGGLVLALAFIVIKSIEYGKMDFRWDDHAYGSAVYAITGFHAAHMVVLVLKTIVILVLAVRGYFKPWRDVGIQVNGIYWYFVVVVWIPIYLVVFVMPKVIP
jgi:cytochrome c oxidase subunit III